MVEGFLFDQHELYVIILICYWWAMLTGAILTAGFYHLYGLVLRDSGHKEMLTDILFYGWLTYRGHPFLLIV
jgi:hypothetical protein